MYVPPCPATYIIICIIAFLRIISCLLGVFCLLQTQLKYHWCPCIVESSYAKIIVWFAAWGTDTFSSCEWWDKKYPQSSRPMNKCEISRRLANLMEHCDSSTHFFCVYMTVLFRTYFYFSIPEVLMPPRNKLRYTSVYKHQSYCCISGTTKCC